MTDHDCFERDILPHLDAAYTLARWLTRDPHHAEDVVQEALLRALRAFATCRDNPRAWLLAIVRNAAFTWLRRHRPEELQPMPDEPADISTPNPEAGLMSAERRAEVQRALDRLPLPYREALLLREVEGMSYRDIAALAQIPIGTVMSRLARAREQLARVLNGAAEAQT